MLNWKSRSGRRHSPMRLWDWVQSRYRAPWKGVITKFDSQTGIATVLVLEDRHGNPMRKGERKQLHIDWLIHLPERENYMEDTFPETMKPIFEDATNE